MSSGQVPFHETSNQGVFGVSEDCRYNDHTLCRSPRCGCSCHRQARVEADHNGVERVVATQERPGPIQTGLDKYCPKCKLKAASDQNFCKKDGTKLSSLRCPECGTPGDQEDNYCGYCGCSMKVSDRQLEAAATGQPIVESRVAVSSQESPVDAEAAMRAALSKSKVEVTKVGKSSIKVGMFK